MQSWHDPQDTARGYKDKKEAHQKEKNRLVAQLNTSSIY